MAPKSLEAKADDIDSLVDMFRENGGDFAFSELFPAIPGEVTNWIDEQRAIFETCALGDLSHHMTTIESEGPDALQFYSDLAVNDFTDFEIGRAKQLVFCNHDGYHLGDGPLLRLGENEFWGVHYGAENWLRYNIETGDYDVTADFDPPSSMRDGDPREFVYQVQGPNTLDVLEQLTDDDLEIPFYRFEELTLAGREVRAFSHGMSPESGFEFHGPYEHADEIKSAIMEAGSDHGIRHLGMDAYNTQSVRLGWVAAGPPSIFEVDEMEDFREWLDEDSREANFSIEGSFDSDSITDYYMDPIEYGYEKLVDFDHDFVGRDALKRKAENKERELVSLLWDDGEASGLFESLFGDDHHYQLFRLPRPRWGNSAFDKVLVDGELVGISRRRSYMTDIRGIVSLAVVDVEYSDPGTEVTVLWGEAHDSPNPRIEEHEQTEISATVSTVPYKEDLRKQQ